jgi:hypothetical protein
MKLKYILMMLSLFIFSGCMRAEMARISAIGSDHKILVYSGGNLVKEFHSVGKVLTEQDSDGWYFLNKETNKLTRVSGTVIVEQE